MALKSKILKNLGANAYGQAVTILIQVVGIPVFIAHWGAGLYGEWLILVAIPAYLALSDVGFSSVAANDMTIKMAAGDFWAASRVYQSIWVLTLSISLAIILLAGAVVFFTPVIDVFSFQYISQEQSRWILSFLAMYVLLGLQIGVISAAYRAAGNFAFGTLLTNNIRLIEFILVAAGLVAAADALQIALLMLASRGLGFVLMILGLRFKKIPFRLGYRHFARSELVRLFKPACAFMAFPLGLAMALQGMILLIGSFLGPASVVIFSTYRTVTRLIIQLVTMINQSTWPEISAAHGAGDEVRVRAIFFKSVFFTFWTGLFVFVIFFFFGDWLLQLWVGENLVQNALLWDVLLVASLLSIQWQSPWVLLMAVNKHQAVSLHFIFSMCISLLCAVLLMPNFGVTGAGMAVVISELLMLYFCIKQVLKEKKWTLRQYIFSTFMIIKLR